MALRECFDKFQRVISPADLGMYLVELRGAVNVVDLRRDRTLDVLGLDDQINTSRAPGAWVACHRLADLLHDWFGERCHGIVYRSRTTPERSANLAFFDHAPLEAHSLGTLGVQDRLLGACLLSDGFTVQGWR